MNKRCAIPLARSLARSFAPRLLALDEGERWNGAEWSGRKRNNASICGQMVFHYVCGVLRHRDGLPRILVEIMIDSRYLPILSDKFGDTDVFANRLQIGKLFDSLRNENNYHKRDKKSFL